MAYVLYQHIENVETSRVVGVLVGRERSYPFERTFSRISADPAEVKGFYALLGTPLGSNVAYLVRGHFADIGHKIVVRIRVS